MPDMNMQTYEEVQRHQLVTEFDVQSQSELEDYQVKLDNIDNSTQAQDNLVIDMNGESLSHWNESLDFDTWVKMNIEASGKRGLLIHGNSGLGSESSITNTMIFGDDFPNSSLDATKWEGYTAGASVSGGVLTYLGDGAAWRVLSSKTLCNDPIITEIRGQMPNANWGGFGIRDQSGHIAQLLRASPTPEIIQHGDGSSYPLVATDFDSTAYHIYKIIWLSNNIFYYEDNIQLSNSPYNANNPEASTSAVGFTSYNGSVLGDYIFTRTYTSIEPIVQIGTPKNISTALKLFGRAG